MSKAFSASIEFSFNLLRFFMTAVLHSVRSQSFMTLCLVAGELSFSFWDSVTTAFHGALMCYSFASAFEVINVFFLKKQSY